MQQAIVGSAFIHMDDKVLIARRSDNKHFLPGIWEIPGGHVEFGESLSEAIAREVEEELHIQVMVGDPFYSFTYLPKPDRHIVEIDCFATLNDDLQEIKLNGEDHSEYKWIGRSEIDIYFDSEDRTRKALIRGFELLNTKSR
jgi:8-oxo-dGTP diphosphatase